MCHTHLGRPILAVRLQFVLGDFFLWGWGGALHSWTQNRTHCDSNVAQGMKDIRYLKLLHNQARKGTVIFLYRSLQFLEKGKSL